ncbi:MAG TPA: DUF2163 domain-containing protein [Kiloniellales bacterium]
MARTIPAGWDLDADTTLAFCLQVTDRLGIVRGFTEHDRPLPVDLGDGAGPIDYEPEAAFGRSAVESRSAGRVGSMDLIGFVDDAGVTEATIFAGIYDSALVKLFIVDWTQPAAGACHIEIGELEQTHVEDDKLTVTFKSLLDRYNAIEFGDIYMADCIHQLGSQPADIPPPFARIGCRVQLDPPVWSAGLAVAVRMTRNAKPTGSEAASPPTVNTVQPTLPNGRFFEAQAAGTTGGSEPSWNTTLGGTTNDNNVVWVARQALREAVTVVSASDQKTLTISYAGDAPDEWYRRGRLLFTTGANAGIERHVKSDVTPSPVGSPPQRLVTCWLNFPLAIAAGDQAVLIAGCDRQLATCKDKFRNLDNFGGFAIFAPNTDEVFKIPKQTS